MSHKESLKNKAVRGFTWSFIDLIAKQGIQLIIQITLTRLLLPEHFGVLGMMLIFIAISNSIVDSGFSQALIRNQQVTRIDYSTVFYFNFLVSICIYALLYVASPTISAFFKEPELIGIIRVVSLVLIINALGMIPNVMLVKKMDFKTQTKISVIAVIGSGAIAITLAILGFGVWSLVVNVLSLQMIQTLLLWFFNKWMPAFVFDKISFKKNFNFGYKLLLSGLIDTFYNNLFYLIIGKAYSAGQLGLYTNAVKIRDQASQSFAASIQRVTYPVLSSIQDDEIRLKIGFKKIIKISAFVNFPLMIGLAAIAHPLFGLLLGEKWLASVLYFQLLCLAGMLYPIHAINLNVLQVTGRSDLFLKLEVIKKIILTILIVLSLLSGLGIIGLIMAAVVSSFISLLINTFYSAREIDYSTKEQLVDLLPASLNSLVMGIVVFYLGTLPAMTNFLGLMIQIIAGMVVYLVMSKLFKLKELQELTNIARPFMARGGVR